MNSQIELQLDEWRGYSAYEVAVRNGFKGTEAEWIASLKGRDGGVATVNSVAHDDEGNVTITAGSIPVSETDERTLQTVTADVDKLKGAISVTDEDIDVGGRYITNARFR